MSKQNQLTEKKFIFGTGLVEIDYKTLFIATLLAMSIVIGALYCYILWLYTLVEPEQIYPKFDCKETYIQTQKGQLCCLANNPSDCFFTYSLSSWEKLADEYPPTSILNTMGD